jgi:hypothetical protein
MLPLCKQSPCLSNCMTTRLETSSQLWTMLDAAKREASHQGAYRAHLIRQRSVVQVHLGPLIWRDRWPNTFHCGSIRGMQFFCYRSLFGRIFTK